MSASKKTTQKSATTTLTERQLAEKKMNKEVKMYTIGFAVVMAVVLVIAIAAGTMRVVNNSGMKERKTIAYTVGEHQLNTVEFNYFYMENVQNFMNQYGPYASMFGLNTSIPLDQQYLDEEQTTTWADDFVNSAKEDAKAIYALSDEAKAQGHKLSETEQAQVDAAVESLDTYAKLNGTGSAKNFLRAVYGPGSTVESYRAYMENRAMALSYQTAKAKSMEYEDAALREFEKDKFDEYSSFTYNQYYLSSTSFLQGGTEAEDGTKTYTDEEKQASVKAAEAAAKELMDAKATTPEALDKAIAALEINKDKDASSTHSDRVDYRNLPTETAKWLADSSRKAGDMTMLPNETTTLDEDGNEVKNIGGYTVLMFGSRDDNQEILPNVRHILTSFEGGTANENGQLTYSEEEKAAAKAKAEDLLAKYESGEKTEDAFAALASENTTDPGSKENGGLYENVYRGQMVPAFNDWVFDSARKAGDTGIVETEYGYHVMYYCGEGSMSFRDMMIRSELLTADMDKWTQDLLAAVTTADGDTSLVNTSLTLAQ